MKRLLLVTLIIATIVALYFMPRSAASFAAPIEVSIYTQKGERILRLETATTPAERETGLMNRDTLAPHDGMLFVFPTADDHAFWMKNTRIPLDMLFIDESHTIVTIRDNVAPLSLDRRSSGKAVIAAMELDGGRAAREGIAPNDKVRYVLPASTKVE